MLRWRKKKSARKFTQIRNRTWSIWLQVFTLQIALAMVTITIFTVVLFIAVMEHVPQTWTGVEGTEENFVRFGTGIRWSLPYPLAVCFQGNYIILLTFTIDCSNQLHENTTCWLWRYKKKEKRNEGCEK